MAIYAGLIPMHLHAGLTIILCHCCHVAPAGLGDMSDNAEGY